MVNKTYYYCLQVAVTHNPLSTTAKQQYNQQLFQPKYTRLKLPHQNIFVRMKTFPLGKNKTISKFTSEKLSKYVYSVC